MTTKLSTLLSSLEELDKKRAHDFIVAAANVLPQLIKVIRIQNEVLSDIECNLEGYPDGRCDACSFNLNFRESIKIVLSKIEELL